MMPKQTCLCRHLRVDLIRQVAGQDCLKCCQYETSVCLLFCHYNTAAYTNLTALHFSSVKSGKHISVAFKWVKALFAQGAVQITNLYVAHQPSLSIPVSFLYTRYGF